MGLGLGLGLAVSEDDWDPDALKWMLLEPGLGDGVVGNGSIVIPSLIPSRVLFVVSLNRVSAIGL